MTSSFLAGKLLLLPLQQEWTNGAPLMPMI